MPCLKILTNLPKQKVPTDFLKKIIPVLAEAVNKPAEKFICVINPDCQLTIAGDSSTPGVIATLESIGNLGLEENKHISAMLSGFIEKELKVAQKRIFMTYYNLDSQNVAINGVTIAYM